jgi:flagellar biosynthesis chaperone FliJ
MNGRPSGLPYGADLRAFRWPLHPLECKLEQALESARLAAGACHAREARQRGLVDEWRRHQAAQERIASACVQGQPRLGTHVLAYLARVEQRLAHAASTADRLECQLAEAREECARRQRELASVQALRERAQHAHAQEQLRRAQKEADAAWLGRVRRTRGHGRGAETE